MKRFSICAIIGGLALAAFHHSGAMGQDKDKDKVADKDRIRGTWSGKLEMSDPGGKEIIAATAVFGAEDVTIELSEGEKKELVKASYKLWSEENPKAIDFFISQGKEKKAQGIYAFEGDVLKICWNANAEPRPKDFVGGGKVDLRLLTLKRQK